MFAANPRRWQFRAFAHRWENSQITQHPVQRCALVHRSCNAQLSDDIQQFGGDSPDIRLNGLDWSRRVDQVDLLGRAAGLF